MRASAKVKKAYHLALLARQRAHCPYSKFKVGAALQIAGKAEAIPGCNVENASFGATMCAERSAIFAAISKYGKIAPEFLVIVTGEAKATVPCGLCLQVLAEFCPDEMPIFLGNEKGPIEERKLVDFLPRAFRVFKVKAK